jgi:hypothetical protein
MTLAKKGRRSLHVQGFDFFWKTSGSDHGVHAVVQLATIPGACLRVSSRYEPSDGQTSELSPGKIARAIEFALLNGWHPSDPGPNFEVILRRGFPLLDRPPRS